MLIKTACANKATVAIHFLIFDLSIAFIIAFDADNANPTIPSIIDANITVVEAEKNTADDNAISFGTPSAVVTKYLYTK